MRIVRLVCGWHLDFLYLGAPSVDKSSLSLSGKPFLFLFF